MDHLILNVLKELANEDFSEFKWFLEKEQVDGLKGIPQSRLEDANRTKTTNLIKQFYHGKETDIMVDILKKLNRNDLAESFETESKEPQCRDVVQSQQSSELQSTKSRSKSKGATGRKGSKKDEDFEAFTENYKSLYAAGGALIGAAKGGREGAERGGILGGKIGSSVIDFATNVAKVLASDSDSD